MNPDATEFGVLLKKSVGSVTLYGRRLWNSMAAVRAHCPLNDRSSVASAPHPFGEGVAPMSQWG
ncbi:hypothetical protein HRbin17_01334 [bacterium HR17]|uniref:Uncharacterized protein n=1 Tax=Candidatus Fervidibacter japonicus TaxID=2035412 RepID=A0A2H5XCA7_9BACT|nr:hypothetical protein HRbin17_01334 [bacterium HR17]